MKKRMFSAVVLSTIFGLLVLAGCDTSTNDIWLADVANPLIGTWGYETTNMMTGVTSTVKKEFKTDGTLVTDDDPTSAVPYLVKGNLLVVSTDSSPFYTKYVFEVIDNNTLRIAQDGRSTTIYTRQGAENPNANRTITLSNSLAETNGDNTYWRPSNYASRTMYDWHTFRKDGTYHVYHWMNNNKEYVDRGEFSYYIDSSNRLVSLSNGYTVTVYTSFTRNTSATPPTISWTDGIATTTLVKFDGEDFGASPGMGGM